MNQNPSNYLKVPYFRPLQFSIPSISSILCLYMVKKDYVKKYRKGDNVTIFWYSLKNLDPV